MSTVLHWIGHTKLDRFLRGFRGWRGGCRGAGPQAPQAIHGGVQTSDRRAAPGGKAQIRDDGRRQGPRGGRDPRVGARGQAPPHGGRRFEAGCAGIRAEAAATAASAGRHPTSTRREIPGAPLGPASQASARMRAWRGRRPRHRRSPCATRGSSMPMGKTGPAMRRQTGFRARSGQGGGRIRGQGPKAGFVRQERLPAPHGPRIGPSDRVDRRNNSRIRSALGRMSPVELGEAGLSL